MDYSTSYEGRQFATIREFSKGTGLSENSVRTMCKTGVLPGFRVGAQGKYIINAPLALAVLDEMSRGGDGV